jgi:quercetin dioxygenase-like cupin family protein
MTTENDAGFAVGTTRHLLGTLVTLLADGPATDGAFSLVEIAVAPGCGTPPHHHADAEAFLVLDGEITFGRGEKALVRRAGEFVFIPSNEVHAFTNATGTVARMLGINLPGGPHVGFFAEAGDPVADGKSFPPMSPPDIPRLMAAAQRHGVTILPPA